MLWTEQGEVSISHLESRIVPSRRPMAPLAAPRHLQPHPQPHPLLLRLAIPPISYYTYYSYLPTKLLPTNPTLQPETAP